MFHFVTRTIFRILLWKKPCIIVWIMLLKLKRKWRSCNLHRISLREFLTQEKNWCLYLLAHTYTQKLVLSRRAAGGLAISRKKTCRVGAKSLTKHRTVGHLPEAECAERDEPSRRVKGRPARGEAEARSRDCAGQDRAAWPARRLPRRTDRSPTERSECWR